MSGADSSLKTHRYFTEDTVDPIAIVAGIVQTAIYSDFFYIYFTRCVHSRARSATRNK